MGKMATYFILLYYQPINCPQSFVLPCNERARNCIIQGVAKVLDLFQVYGLLRRVRTFGAPCSPGSALDRLTHT